MKKIITIALVGVLALSMTACTKKAPENDQIIGGNPSNSNSIDYANVTSHYGKVSAIAGNELTFDLANLPGAGDAPTSMPEGEDGMMSAVTMTPATPAGEAGTDSAGAENRIEVEYTGESKDFVIPAGLEIKDSSGAVKQLSDIKKGTVLNIFTDKDGNIVEVLYIA